jgi:hypothetical protein
MKYAQDKEFSPCRHRPDRLGPFRGRPADRALHHVRLVARHGSRISRRPSHPGRFSSSALRHDPVHRLGSDVLRCLVLGLFRRRPVCRRSPIQFAARRGDRRKRIGGPPEGIETFDPWHLPLLNTLILLTSGTTVTWAHHALLHNDRKGLKWGLTLTVLLGVLFTICRPTSTATRRSTSAATSTARPSSWRPASTVSTSSSGRSSCSSA